MFVQRDCTVTEMGEIVHPTYLQLDRNRWGRTDRAEFIVGVGGESIPDPLGDDLSDDRRQISVGHCLAGVRGTTLEAFAAQTTANAKRLFQV